MKKILPLVLLSLFITGCAGLKVFPDWPSTPAKKQTQNYSEREYLHVKPQSLTCPKCGNVMIAPQPEVTKEYTRNLEATTPPTTLLDRIKAAFGILGFWGILILVVVVVLLGPGPVIMFLWGRYRKWKAGMIETVAAIKESKVVDRDPELHNALLKRQSKRTMETVNKLRVQI